MSDGQVLAERYRLIEQLSRGGMGSVWRAEHIELGTPAAVKLIDPTLADTEEALIRFRREAQAAASLRSSNIVQIFDYGVAGGIPYIAMELLRGQSLARRLATNAPLSPLETAVILMQVGKAVAWAHSMGVVHRDLKPDNVFLAEDAGETVVKLLDFGIAKTFSLGFAEPPTTVAGAIMGTPYYMSPEQAVGDRTVDYRSDIWSYGVIAFECLTGQRPFAADSVGGLVLAICSGKIPKPSDCAEVPAGFDEWFVCAANRDPAGRFPSIRDAAVELRRICAKDLDDDALGLSASGNRLITHTNEIPANELSTSTIANSNSSTAVSTAGDLPISKRGSTLQHKAPYFALGLIVAVIVLVAALSTSPKPAPDEPAGSSPSPAVDLGDTRATARDHEAAAPATLDTQLAPPTPSAPPALKVQPAPLPRQEPLANRTRSPRTTAASPSIIGPMSNPTGSQQVRSLVATPTASSTAPSAATLPAAKASGPDLDRMVGF